jgi:hypothetical protein
MRTILKRDPNKPGPLESYKMAGHCEMCGASDFQPHPELEPAFNPSGEPKTLCRDCRIGSAELLADVRAELLTVLRKFVDYYNRGEAPQFTIELLQDVAIDAAAAIAKAERKA